MHNGIVKIGQKIIVYHSPFATRYASKEMQEIFSDLRKHRFWRLLWYVLAREQSKLGLPITEEQLKELRHYLDDVNLDDISLKEKETHHDVMAHIHVYGAQCPLAKGIIHLGATSCFVTDNADIINIRSALILIAKKLITTCQSLYEFATNFIDLPCLGYTHYQPAQLTTVGKRASLWLHDLYNDLEQILHVISQLKFRGIKGATGTQASFLKLFNNQARVEKLDNAIASIFNFPLEEITGQTYSRKQDLLVVQSLVQLSVSATKMANDIRLLAHDGEIEEGFAKTQVGSSAMPYKKNPMKCERVVSLGRYLINMSNNASDNAANQWLERTLDDSANRRLSIAESFLSADAILGLLQKIIKNLVVNKDVITKRVTTELPFIAMENLMMELALKGEDRQELHHRIKQHAMAAKSELNKGRDNDLLERLRNDELLSQYVIETNPRALTGRAPAQTVKSTKEICAKLYAHQINVFKMIDQEKEMVHNISKESKDDERSREAETTPEVA